MTLFWGLSSLQLVWSIMNYVNTAILHIEGIHDATFLWGFRGKYPLLSSRYFSSEHTSTYCFKAEVTTCEISFDVHSSNCTPLKNVQFCWPWAMHSTNPFRVQRYNPLLWGGNWSHASRGRWKASSPFLCNAIIYFMIYSVISSLSIWRKK